jgi:hypothetical protein
MFLIEAKTNKATNRVVELIIQNDRIVDILNLLIVQNCQDFLKYSIFLILLLFVESIEIIEHFLASDVGNVLIHRLSNPTFLFSLTNLLTSGISFKNDSIIKVNH